jgi:hypothetical protein
LWR